MTWFAYVVSLLAGAANPLQSATNGELNKQLHQPIWAGIVVYATGLLGMLVLQLFTRQPVPMDGVAGVSWWAWLGGLISVASTLAGLTMVHKLGSGVFTGLSITASLVVSVVLDHFGLLGLERHPAGIGRLAGCCLLVGGVWMVSRF